LRAIRAAFQDSARPEQAAAGLCKSFMPSRLKLTGYFAGVLFSGQELYGNCALAEEIERVSKGLVKICLPQDLSTQEAGDDPGTRAADYLGMIQQDFVFANMNGPELDSGTVAEYMVASMLGMPRVQFRSDFRNVGDVRTSFKNPADVGRTASVPYNLMLCHDESAFVYLNSMELYKTSANPKAFVRRLAAEALKGIKLAFRMKNAKPNEYPAQQIPLERYLKLDGKTVAEILKKKQRRHEGEEYREAVTRLVRR
jgi:nucleoside 2-deoxyribosyltransferase